MKTQSRSQQTTRRRPVGSIKSLLNDDQRFALAAAYTGQLFGLGSRVAAFLALTAIESDEPITIETVRDALVIVSSEYKSNVNLTNRAAGLAKKLDLILNRVSRRERDWLTYSVGALTALVHSTAAKNRSGINTALDMLEGAGWRDTLARMNWRITAALRSNFPEVENELSTAAIRLLAEKMKSGQ